MSQRSGVPRWRVTEKMVQSKKHFLWCLQGNRPKPVAVEEQSAAITIKRINASRSTGCRFEAVQHMCISKSREKIILYAEALSIDFIIIPRTRFHPPPDQKFLGISGQANRKLDLCTSSANSPTYSSGSNLQLFYLPFANRSVPEVNCVADY